MSFIRNSLLTLLGTIGQVVFSMVNQIFISRILGPGGKGLYAFLVQIPTVLVPASSLGLNYANTYYIAKDHTNSRRAVGSSTMMAVLLGGFMDLLLLVAYLFLRHSYLAEMTVDQLVLILIAMPFALVGLYWLGILWGLDRIGKYNLALLVPYLVMAAGVLVFTLFGALTVTTGLGIWAAGNVVAAFYMLPQMLKISEGRLFRWDRAYLRQATGYSLKSYLYNMMNVISYRLGVFIITGFTTKEQVGLYATAVTLAEMVKYGGNAVNTALIPKLASGSDQVTFKQTPRICRITLLITVIAALGLAALGYPLIVLVFGRAFAGSFYPLLFMLPGVVALAGATVLSGDLMARGKPNYTSTASGIGMVLTVILNFVLVPLWGIYGAAVASTLVYIVMFAVYYVFYRRESGEGLSGLLFLTREDVRTLLVLAGRLKLPGKKGQV